MLFDKLSNLHFYQKSPSEINKSQLSGCKPKLDNLKNLVNRHTWIIDRKYWIIFKVLTVGLLFFVRKRYIPIMYCIYFPTRDYSESRKWPKESQKGAEMESNEKTDKKTGMISIKVSPIELDKLKRASNLSNMNMSEFIMGYALEKANKILRHEPSFRFLEKKNGEWFFKNRKLRVFDNFYMFDKSEIKFRIGEWCDMYGLSTQAFNEAKECVAFYKDDFNRWIDQYLKEDLEDISAY